MEQLECDKFFEYDQVPFVLCFSRRKHALHATQFNAVGWEMKSSWLKN